MTVPTPSGGATAGVPRGGQEARVLVASLLPILCAFLWALHLFREASRLPLDLDLSKAQPFIGLRGFSAPEAWGRWTDGEEAALVLAEALPDRFDLALEAWAYGPNAGLPVEVRAGGAFQTVLLGPSRGSRSLSFRGASGRRLVFHVPHPVRPREVGDGGDDRLLGIAIARLQIRTPGGTF
jgi:hypothetical protein